MISELATFGGGCFWCTEAVFQKVNGVLKVESGYSGGQIKNPAYREVCNGTTGHAEVVQITFDNSVVNFQELVRIFFFTHDPTTINRQGNDIGTQYRSVIFYHTNEQKTLSEQVKEALNVSGEFSKPIVTAIEPFTYFYRAEEDHQNYFLNNTSQPYCSFVIKPKVEKFKKMFGKYLTN
ncbi:MAG: peptide-methionine (S)-S-oxide reductase MsrA [Bacteroidetes bacterium]|nr:peptide-methionine (S)-S-oxide reductase MsrA [Bacteroidales bacterium]NJO68010.1 peptide-methionine (S)-S-oxide reductase MsrA [Bacteroidota bacterium]